MHGLGFHVAEKSSGLGKNQGRDSERNIGKGGEGFQRGVRSIFGVVHFQGAQIHGCKLQSHSGSGSFCLGHGETLNPEP